MIRHLLLDVPCFNLEGALEFDGVNDFCQNNGPSGLERAANQDFHLETWINILDPLIFSSPTSAFYAIAGSTISTGANDRFALQFGGAAGVTRYLLFDTVDGPRIFWRLGLSGITATNTWYHIAITRTGGNVWRLYVDGALTPNAVAEVNKGSGWALLDGYQIGCFGSSQFSNIRLAGFCSFNGTVTQAEIQARANNPCAEVCPDDLTNAAFYYPFQEVAGSTANDFSPNGRALSLSNFTGSHWQQPGPCVP